MRNLNLLTRLLPAASLAVCVALAGCATPGGLHPTGKTLDARSLKSERSFSQVQLSPTAWPAQDWWVSFGDPQLSTLIDEALKTAAEIAAMPPLAAIAVKEMVNAAFEGGLAQGISFERRLFHGLFGTEDQKEGMSAFVEKRPGNRTGR